MSYAKRNKAQEAKKSAFKDKINGQSFIALRTDMVNSEEFRALTTAAKTVFIHFLGMYNGRNNGNLAAPLNQAKKLFNVSKNTLIKVLLELENKGFIETTQGGEKYCCALYALTCFAYDEIKGKALLVNPTRRAPDTWKKARAEKNTHATNSTTNGAPNAPNGTTHSETANTAPTATHTHHTEPTPRFSLPPNEVKGDEVVKTMASQQT